MVKYPANQKRRLALIAAGKCQQCNVPAAKKPDGTLYKQCEKCREYHRNYYRQLRKKAQENA